MIKQLIHDKINEVFLEHQKEFNVTSGDIHPQDAFHLDRIEDELKALIEKVVAYQPKAINFDDFTPSWYIYTDSDGEAHCVAFGEITENQFFTKVSKKIAFDDLDDSTVHKIYFRGKEVEYAGWQPCMTFEYKDLDGNTVWIEQFEEWDH